MSSRGAARAGLTLYSPCRATGIWVQRLAWWLVGIGGPRLLPGEVVEFQPPEAWRELQKVWTGELGSFDDVAVIQRRQADRQGFSALLISNDKPTAFVRVEHGLDPEVATEVEALRLVAAFRPGTFKAPAVLTTGQVANWGYIASSALPVAIHKPPTRPPIEEITAEIQAALGALARPAGISDWWLPMHGDLTPWNLRALSNGQLVLFDWERAGWGPPEVDRVLYEASEIALGWRGLPSAPHDRAADFWLSGQGGKIEDERLRNAVAAYLEDVQPEA